MNIGPYQLGRSLGTGTVCESFLATDSSGKSVIIKRLTAPVAGNQQVIERFVNASVLSAKITSPRFLTKVLMHHQSDSGVHLVRDYVEGKSLAQIEAEGGLADLNGKQLALDLCEALRALHRQGIIHGGIHPGNVFVQSDGRLKLTDYGISRVLLMGSVDAEYSLSAMRYLAPEMIRGRAAGLAADICSAGLVAYLLAERKHLIEGTTAARIRDNIEKAHSAAAQFPARALSPDPGNRFSNPDELRAALMTWFDSRTATTSPPPAREEPVPPPPPAVPVAPRVENPVGARGTLAAVRDLKSGQDLLSLKGHPWQLRRSAMPQEWPIVFANSGPGDLHLRVRCVGDGLRLTPFDRLRVPPATSRYVILQLDQVGGDFARLEIEVEGGKVSELVRIRLYRPQ
ncbi:MAG: serine/threonine protein kinase [Planctomycetes bacterium]|nr:serine/threonine protein kinase [Planctomycetota bacterium]